MPGCIQPISSPMMKRMLGFCCCAAAGAVAAVTAAHNASKPSDNRCIILMRWLPEVFDLDRLQRVVPAAPGKHAARSSRASRTIIAKEASALLDCGLLDLGPIDKSVRAPLPGNTIFPGSGPTRAFPSQHCARRDRRRVILTLRQALALHASRGTPSAYP